MTDDTNSQPHVMSPIHWQQTHGLTVLFPVTILVTPCCSSRAHLL